MAARDSRRTDQVQPFWVMGSTRGPIVHLTTGRYPHAPRVYSHESRSLVEAGYEVCNVGPGHDASDGDIQMIPVRKPHNRAERMIITPWIVTWRALRLRPAAWHLHDANLIPAGLLLRLFRQRVVWDGHEILRDLVRERSWIPRPLRSPVAALVALLERLAVRVFSATIFGEPGAAAAHGSLHTIIRNFPVLDDYEPPPARDDYIARDAIAMYTGDITHTRGAVEMVRAVGRVSDKLNVRLDLVGRISIPGLREELQTLDGWGRVEYTDWIKPAGLPRFWTRARLGLAVLHPTRQYVHSVPTKLFEYMAIGLPLIASDFETWRSYVEPFECGILVDPRDVDQIVEAITWMISNPEASWEMGRRGRLAIEEKFNWSSEGARLVALYDELLGGSGTTRSATDPS